MTKKIIGAACLALLALGGTAAASSHREAPAIAQDQFADNTDVYLFISPTDANKVVMVANYVPLLIPHSGPNFYRFADSVRYEIHVDNDGDAVADWTYRYEFQTTTMNGGTFLYNTGAVTSLTDGDLNVRQTYTLTKVNVDTGAATVVGTGDAAPWYVGKNTFTNDAGYDAVANMAIETFGTTRSFAGPRDEPFFVDLHVFDVLGVAGFASTNGVNVMSIVLEVPVTDVASGGARPATAATGPTTQLGVWATASRRQVSILRKNRAADWEGQWVQVSRLGWPLINEVVVPLQDKDRYNRSQPAGDGGFLGGYVMAPIIHPLLEAVLGIDCPAAATGRADIVTLLTPSGTTVADMLRLDIRDGQTFTQSTFPNGRKLEDDVTDTLLTVVCGMTLGDAVNANDKPFSTAFPHLATPHSGNP